jgi:hypothetical protein
MWSRRESIIGGALTLLFSGGCACRVDAQSARTSHSEGCYLSDADLDAIYPENTDTRLFFTGNEPMIPRSGDRDFDMALAQTLAKLSDIMGVLPGFAYYDDYDARNAYATARVRMSRADGTVLFGQRLLQQLRAGSDNPEVAVAAVCAHEFGHIVQYKHSLVTRVRRGEPTVRRLELQADFLAGYFAGFRKRERPNFPAAVVATTTFSLGDNNVGHKSHHGTPDERAAATVRGFEVAYKDKKNFNDAIQESINYATRI